MDLTNQIRTYKAYIALISLSLFLTALDLVPTYALHWRGHIEGNPFMRQIITGLGINTMIVINTILSVLLIALLALASTIKLKGNYQYLPLIVYCGIRGSAFLNNLLILTDVV